MAAIFATPVAAILLAVELLLFEWKPRSLIPVAVSALVAAILRVPLLGPGPPFPVAPHNALSASELGFALLVGLGAGLGATLVTSLVYRLEDLFQKLPIHWMWWPAIGAVFVGIGGYEYPEVLGVGYKVIDGLLNGTLIGPALLGLLIGKALVWSIALGSGTSGGVLAPLLIIGGALGAFASRWIGVGDASLWALVGMAAMMSGTMNAPLTATVFALELTHDLNALPAIMIGSIAALGVAVLLLRRSILTEKIARHGHHVTREYSIDVFELLRVGDVMDKNPPTIPADMSLAEFSDLVAKGDPRLSRRQGTLIVDDNGELCGIITRGDAVRGLQQKIASLTVLGAGKRDPIVSFPDEPLTDAISRMLKHDVGRLPAERQNSRQVVGYLGRSNVMAARAKLIEEEDLRERGQGVSPATAAA